MLRVLDGKGTSGSVTLAGSGGVTVTGAINTAGSVGSKDGAVTVAGAAPIASAGLKVIGGELTGGTFSLHTDQLATSPSAR